MELDKADTILFYNPEGTFPCAVGFFSGVIFRYLVLTMSSKVSEFFPPPLLDLLKMLCVGKRKSYVTFGCLTFGGFSLALTDVDIYSVEIIRFEPTFSFKPNNFHDQYVSTYCALIGIFFFVFF